MKCQMTEWIMMNVELKVVMTILTYHLPIQN
jgi:hypothetical protein